MNTARRLARSTGSCPWFVGCGRWSKTCCKVAQSNGYSTAREHEMLGQRSAPNVYCVNVQCVVVWCFNFSLQASLQKAVVPKLKQFDCRPFFGFSMSGVQVMGFLARLLRSFQEHDKLCVFVVCAACWSLFVGALCHTRSA